MAAEPAIASTRRTTVEVVLGPIGIRSGPAGRWSPKPNPEIPHRARQPCDRIWLQCRRRNATSATTSPAWLGPGHPTGRAPRTLPPASRRGHRLVHGADLLELRRRDGVHRLANRLREGDQPFVDGTRRQREITRGLLGVVDRRPETCRLALGVSWYRSCRRRKSSPGRAGLPAPRHLGASPRRQTPASRLPGDPPDLRNTNIHRVCAAHHAGQLVGTRVRQPGSDLLGAHDAPPPARRRRRATSTVAETSSSQRVRFRVDAVRAAPGAPHRRMKRSDIDPISSSFSVDVEFSRP
ncbi:hypothetical protein [Alloactinosynnema sp. L-07]|nr:hypothetical protein [Alloactinosynnema sp. L-07]